MITTLAFFALAAATLACAVGVVRSDNLVHSVFWLAGSLIATAGLFVLLDAPFLAGIQIVLYTGGVITLMLFGVMLTHRNPDKTVPNPMAQSTTWGASIAGLVFLHLVAVAWSVNPPVPPPVTTPQDIGSLFLGRHVIAFEALSVLLLAAMIGAIVLARRTDP